MFIIIVLDLFLTLVIGMSLGLIAVIVAWYVFQVLAYWLIFVKAGQSGWKSLIPIYNEYTQYKITWNTTIYWVFLILCILTSIFSNMEDSLHAVGTICMLLASLIAFIEEYKFSKAFGHGILFTLGLIFFNPVFMLILGFGPSQYHGPQ